MQFAQVVITDEQALLTRVALDLVLQDEERFVMSDEERADYARLAVFFGKVAQHPGAFPPTGKRATAVRQIVRRAKGSAQPQSRRNKRKARQEKRMSNSKRRRAERQEFTKLYNEALEKFEAERAEMEAAELELIEKFKDEPRVMVLRADGVPILTDVPASMVVPMPTEADSFEDLGTYIPPTSETEGGALADDGTFTPLSKIVLPAGVDA